MTIVLAKEIYPLQSAQIAADEFEAELNIKIGELDEFNFTIEFTPTSENVNPPHSINLFLNRFLEVAVLERFV